MCILSKTILSRTNKFVFTASAQVYPSANWSSSVRNNQGRPICKVSLNTQKKQRLSNLGGSTLQSSLRCCAQPSRHLVWPPGCLRLFYAGTISLGFLFTWYWETKCDYYLVELNYIKDWPSFSPEKEKKRKRQKADKHLTSILMT